MSNRDVEEDRVKKYCLYLAIRAPMIRKVIDDGSC